MKRKIGVVFIILSLIVSMFAIPTFADATTVVTIGQDLSDEQEAFIIKYFGADLSTAEVIYVNNQQEREYVGSWIPLEQIGNITISSAYVQPTKSGGIQVKTANLTYVTGNMIASVLSTAGVKNCNVVAAAPFPVSGTGALTGVMIAYQQATNAPLTEEKRELAIQEFTMTQQISESIDENEALQLVNAVKLETIQQNPDADNREQIENIVNQVINNVEVIDNSITNVDNSTTIINNGLSDEDKEKLVDFAEEIARQDYQYDEVIETLKRVEENLSKETNISIVIDNDNENINNVENNNDVSNVGDNITIDNENTDIVVNEPDFEIVTEENVTFDEPEEEIEESILENTNDDLIDINYQSSTRLEDIEAIEQEKVEIEENSDDVTIPEFVEEREDETGIWDEFETEIWQEFPEEPSVEEPVWDETVESFENTEENFAEEFTEEPGEEIITEEIEGVNSCDEAEENLPFAMISDYSIRVYSKEYIDPEDVTISLVNEFDEEITVEAKETFTATRQKDEDDEFVIEVFIPEEENYKAAHIVYQDYDEVTALNKNDVRVTFDVHNKNDVALGKTLYLTIDTSDVSNIEFEVDDEVVSIEWQEVIDEITYVDLSLNDTGNTKVVVYFYDEYGDEIEKEEHLIHIYDAAEEDVDYVIEETVEISDKLPEETLW